MSALLQTTPNELANLRRQALDRCLAFADEPLPPGASRPTGRVGIEVIASTGTTRLYVDRSLSYTGPVPEVAAWFASGTRTFERFDDLEAWILGPLADAYEADGRLAGDDPTGAGAGADEAGVAPVYVDPADIATILSAEVVGQATCVADLADAVGLHLARSRPRRPLTALALGPTGVGKTLMAETLARAVTIVTGQDCDHLRLDMTEFQERHSVAKLFGAPPGYVGFGEDAPLVDVLSSGRRVVVLIDEIEKAHPEVFLAIMNLMDAGRITPASRPPVDARHAVLFFTTNLAADTVEAAVDADPLKYADPVARDALVRSTLRAAGTAPELVGRLDRLLVFRGLEDRHLDEVLRRTIRREADTFGLVPSTICPSVLAHLRSHAPDPGSGVRAWEYLTAATLGAALRAACTDERLTPSRTVAVLGDPIRVEATG